jgi:branched-chain amino acid transport system permease protein
VDRRILWLLKLLLLVFAILFPFLFRDPYHQHILIVAFLSAMCVYSFNIITGMTGQLNAGLAGFVGIGAYVSALAAVELALPFWIALLLSVSATGLLGLFIAYPTLRVRGVYFAITTLSVGEILHLIFDNWVRVTGGPMGYTGIPAPSPLSFLGVSLNFEGKTGFYYLSLAFILLILYVNRQLFHSRLGRAMLSVKENPDLAQSVGISIARIKIISFVISALLLGVCGSLYAHYFRVLSPITFSLHETFRYLSMLIVGGMGTVSGPLVGALVMTILPEFLRSIEDYQWVTYGLALMLCIIFLPEGIVGFINKILSQLRSGLFKGERK